MRRMFLLTSCVLLAEGLEAEMADTKHASPHRVCRPWGDYRLEYRL
jgi:hypothetical protein